MKKLLTILIIPLLFSSCAPSSSTAPIKSVDELSHKEDVYEIISHLYRWHLDEVDVRNATKNSDKRIWIRETTPTLDEGDNSRFAEMILPSMGIKVTLKKADYSIEKINLTVKSDNFKITRVSRIDIPKNLKEGFAPFILDRDSLREYLFTKRGEVKYPEGAMLDGLRAAAHKQVAAHIKSKGIPRPKSAQPVHFSPLSPVANEIWAFWEGGRMLVHFSADIDIKNPYVWKNDVLSAKIYDTDEQVVVSLQEVAGSNAYLTRDQVGRALYNCVVLGKRIVLEPAQQ